MDSKNASDSVIHPLMAPASTEGWVNNQNSTEEGHKDTMKTKTSVEALDLKEDKKRAQETVPFTQLFKFSSRNEKVLLVIGCLAAFLSGGIFPTMNVLLGSLLDVFIEKETTDNNFGECFRLNTTNNSATTTRTTLSEAEFIEIVFSRCSSLCIGMLVISLIQIILGYGVISCLNTVAENQALKIRDRFMRAILRQDIGWFDTHSVGDFASRITADLGRVQDGMGQKFGLVICFTSSSLISLVVAFYYGWKLTLVVLAVMPLIIASNAIIAQIQAKLTGGELDAYGKAGEVAEEVFSSIRTVVAFGGEKKEIDRYEKNLLEARKSGMKRGLFTALGNTSFWMFTYMSYALAFWYGSKLILDSRCNAERFTPAMMFIVFFCVLIGAMFIGQAAPYAEAIAVARGAAKKLFDIIDRQPPIDSSSENGEKPNIINGYIALKEVSFSYPSRPDVQILNKLSLDAVPGETVALVGASGCGKSTVVQLVQRFYDPSEGMVSIDGRDIRDLNVAWLRNHIGVVGQEPVLFDTTIAENILYGCESATQENVEKAAKEANAHDFIMKLPNKYSTLVGEKGAQLSGGQKQRIAIARALIRNPKILLLDEATSALDTESEATVQAALDQASVGRTTLVVAHRLSTIRSANKIIALESGQVKEFGSHEELMEKQGLYYQLVMAQQMDHDENNENPLVRKRIQFRKKSTISIHSEDGNALPLGVDDKETDKLVEDANPSKFRLIKMSMEDWPFIITGTIGALFMGILLPIYGVIFGNILSALSKERREAEKNVVFFCLLFIALGLTTGIASFLQTFMFTISGERLTMRLRKLVFTKIITQEMAWFDDNKNSTGALCSKLASDASGVQGATGARLSTIIQALATLVAAIVIALTINLKIGFVVLTFIPLVMAGTFLESRANSGQILSEKKAVEQASKIAVDAIQNIRTVASLNLEEKFSSAYISSLSTTNSKAKRNAHILGILFGFAQAVPWMANSAAMFYGSYLIKTGEIFYGDLFKVSESVFAGAWVIGGMVAFAPDYDAAKVAACRIFEILDRVSQIDIFSNYGQKPSSSNGKIVFSDVHFNYPSRSEIKILNGLNIEVHPGSTLALVGSSGCGKSTCIQLLERFYDPSEGDLQLDGISTRDINLNWMRSQIGLVSQEPVLFGYSIAENIAYGDTSRQVQMDEIIESAKKANIHSFIQSLPGGYDTHVGAKGTQLSGGQKQRVAIARALVRNPNILLLDEATSALDTESEKVVQEAIDTASEGRTCITIAHRLSTIQHADMIVVIHKGKVVEKGTHQELLSMNGFYYKLSSKQGGVDH